MPMNLEPADSDETRCARGGGPPDFTTRSSAPAIWQTTAFDVQSLDQLDAIAAGREKGYLYTRDGNPNHDAFAADVAALEGAEAGVVCASGMGAFTACLLALVGQGDHIVASRVLYGRTVQLLNHLQAAFGVRVTFADAARPEEFARAVTGATRLAIVESISNPLMEVADLPVLAAAMGAVPLVVDNTFATPCLLKPLEHGARLVFHSASKYLNGHGDVMLGVAVGESATIRRVKGMASLFGLNSNPFECWLASRGLRTLPLRMRQVSQTALDVARALQRHPAVQRVYYPGLDDHSSREIAGRLLPRGAGGMLAFELAGGRPAVNALFQALGEIPFSPTLADARTTVSYPAGTSHKFMTASERQACGIGDGLVRLSVGLEATADLQQELSRGLG